MQIIREGKHTRENTANRERKDKAVESMKEEIIIV